MRRTSAPLTVALALALGLPMAVTTAAGAVSTTAAGTAATAFDAIDGEFVLMVLQTSSDGVLDPATSKGFEPGQFPTGQTRHILLQLAVHRRTTVARVVRQLNARLLDLTAQCDGALRSHLAPLP